MHIVSFKNSTGVVRLISNPTGLHEYICLSEKAQIIQFEIGRTPRTGKSHIPGAVAGSTDAEGAAVAAHRGTGRIQGDMGSIRPLKIAYGTPLGANNRFVITSYIAERQIPIEPVGSIFPLMSEIKTARISRSVEKIEIGVAVSTVGGCEHGA